jgi:AcrR family transcriptional regulator
MNDTKSHILKISLKLFLQKNFKEVTMKEILEKTGLSKGGFYHHFETKEQLFREIMEYFFQAILQYDFMRLPKDSLYNFYHKYAEEMNTLRFEFLSFDKEGGEDFIHMNFFALLFDAFKLFPEFKTRLEEYHQKEKKAWMNIIENARRRGEIKTPLTNEQVAKIFLFTSDGLTMNLTMDSKTGNLDKELASLWDNLYATLKA